jgi:acetyl-CoA carboxylase alpha subunit
MEYTWYSVISPESCSSILWHSWDYKERAADELRLTAEDMFRNKLIDGIIREPIGGAHSAADEAAMRLKTQILSALEELKSKSTEQLLEERIAKYDAMGQYAIDLTIKKGDKSKAAPDELIKNPTAQNQAVELHEEEIEEADTSAE